MGVRRWLPFMCTGVLLAACTGQEPSASAPAHFNGLAISEALLWFEDRTLECLGPDQPLADPHEWRCTHEFEDGSSLEVRITADQSGVSRLLGVANDLPPEDAASYLGTTVAGIAVPEDRREELTKWSLERGISGGARVVGSADIELQPHSEHQAIFIDALLD